MCAHVFFYETGRCIILDEISAALFKYYENEDIIFFIDFQYIRILSECVQNFKYVEKEKPVLFNRLDQKYK